MASSEPAWADFVQRAEVNVEAAGLTLSRDSVAVEAYLRADVPVGSDVVHTDADLADVEAWAAGVHRHPGTGVLLDATTIVTLRELLQGERITPLTLWDLSRAITSVVCYDSVYHFENPEVDDKALNTALGGSVFRPVAIPHGGDHYDPAGVKGLFNLAWAQTDSLMRSLERSIGSDTFEGRAAQDLAQRWSRALGRELTARDVIDTEQASYQWTSPGMTLLGEITATGLSSKGLDLMLGMVKLAEADAPPEHVESELTTTFNFVRESNYRGHVNERLARHLRLPYLPNVARLPFRGLLDDQPRLISDRLPSVLALDEHHAERAAQAQHLGGDPFVLPVFLALALRGVRKPEDVWSAIAELRAHATAYRRRRKDLDEALEDQDLDRTAATLAAVRTEARKLSGLLLDAAKESGDKAWTSVETNPVSYIAATPLDWALKGVTFLMAGARKLMPASVAHRLAWRFCRPEFRFLSDMSSESRAITDSMPSVQRIWGMGDSVADEFVRRYQVIGTLPGISR